MAQLGYAFDANEVDPSSPRDVIPAGDYLVHIIASEMKPTKNGDGQYLELEMEVLDGPHQNSHLWARLNLANQNQQAVEIAHRELSAICRATGIMNVSDSEQLHFKPMIAKVKVRLARADAATGKTFGATNEIGGYKAAAGAAPTAVTHTHPRPPAQPAARPATPPAVPAAASNPPWRRAAG